MISIFNKKIWVCIGALCVATMVKGAAGKDITVQERKAQMAELERKICQNVTNMQALLTKGHEMMAQEIAMFPLVNCAQKKRLLASEKERAHDEDERLKLLAETKRMDAEYAAHLQACQGNFDEAERSGQEQFQKFFAAQRQTEAALIAHMNTLITRYYELAERDAILAKSSDSDDNAPAPDGVPTIIITMHNPTSGK